MQQFDKVFINNLRVLGILGVHEQERNQTREILINIILYTSTHRAAQTDKIEDCVDYDLTAQEIRALVKSAKRFTIEALAEDIAQLCLKKPGVQKVSVKVDKPGAVAETDSVGVEIVRRKDLYLKW